MIGVGGGQTRGGDDGQAGDTGVECVVVGSLASQRSGHHHRPHIVHNFVGGHTEQIKIIKLSNNIIDT